MNTTAERIARVLELRAKATPGEWMQQGMGGIRMDCLRDAYAVERVIPPDEQNVEPPKWHGYTVAHMRTSDRQQQHDDSAFIASAPEMADLLALLRDECAALRAAVAAGADLIEVVRMPNIEYVADAHNAAVRSIKAARAAGAAT